MLHRHQTALSFAKSAVASVLACVALGGLGRATWSIVAVDRSTGEVAVAGATCIADSFLQSSIGVVVVGRGAAAGQAVSSPIANTAIGDMLHAGIAPEEIIQSIGPASSLAFRQFGIVNFDDPAVTFTGNNVGVARPGVAGEVGTIRYAIQGNVLAGDDVVFAAEQTFRNAQGDLGQRLMAAMETAREYGGDGRCSCVQGQPNACGSPPPSFTHSAFTAFIVVSRIGDQDGQDNWHSGDYYLERRFVGNANEVDPVIGMQARYDVWRMNRIGVVDGILSEVHPGATRLPADGTTTTDVTVVMRDIDGNKLAFGGFPLQVRGIGGPQAASVETVVDNGDGTFTIRLRAGGEPGHCRFRLVAEQGARARTLHPPLELDVDALTGLHVGRAAVSASAGASVPLVTNAGTSAAGRAYQVLASASGTQPGTPFGGGVLPLNADRLLRFTLAQPGGPRFPGSAGQLDADGRAEARLEATPQMLAPFVGGRFDFATVLFGSPDEFTEPAGFDVLP